MLLGNISSFGLLNWGFGASQDANVWRKFFINSGLTNYTLVVQRARQYVETHHKVVLSLWSYISFLWQFPPLFVLAQQSVMMIEISFDGMPPIVYDPSVHGSSNHVAYQMIYAGSSISAQLLCRNATPT